MAIKVDLEKAYDRLKWDFIRNTLMEMRIPQNLVDVIMMCITTCSMRILWNERPQKPSTQQEVSDKGIHSHRTFL